MWSRGAGTPPSPEGVKQVEQMSPGEDRAETEGTRSEAFAELRQLGKDLVYLAMETPGLKWWT